MVAFGGLFPLLAGPAFAAWLGVPLVTLVRGNDFDTALFSVKRGDVVREALARAAAIGAVTEEQVAKIRALYPGARVAWTPNGIDVTDWRLTDQDRARGRAWRQAHLSEEAAACTVWGLFGHLKQKKGTLLFLEALAAAGALGSSHALIVGDVEPAVDAWLQRHAPPRAYTRLPFCDRYELLPFYAAVDLVALPSFYDGMPNVLLEAAALGVPVLGSDAGAMPEVLGREAAFSFAAGDHHGCRRAIERALAANAAVRAGAGAAARQRVIDRFDTAAETRRHLDILAQAVLSSPS